MTWQISSNSNNNSILKYSPIRRNYQTRVAEIRLDKIWIPLLDFRYGMNIKDRESDIKDTGISSDEWRENKDFFLKKEIEAHNEWKRNVLKFWGFPKKNYKKIDKQPEKIKLKKQTSQKVNNVPTEMESANILKKDK